MSFCYIHILKCVVFPSQWWLQCQLFQPLIQGDMIAIDLIIKTITQHLKHFETTNRSGIMDCCSSVWYTVLELVVHVRKWLVVCMYWSPVYTIQPVIKLVWQPVVSCKPGMIGAWLIHPWHKQMKSWRPVIWGLPSQYGSCPVDISIIQTGGGWGRCWWWPFGAIFL